MLRNSVRPYICWRCLTSSASPAPVARGSGFAHRGFSTQSSLSREQKGGFKDSGRGRGVGHQRKMAHELSEEELSNIRSRSNIRERLRTWESENHIPATRLLQDVPTRDIPLSNYLTRADHLPGSTEARNFKDDMGDATLSRNNRALYDGDELERLRGATSALLPGDLVETRYGAGRSPVLAICLGHHYGRQYFYMSNGEVVPEASMLTLFTITNFVDPAKFQHVVDVIPDKVFSHPRNVLFHRKNPEALEAVAELQKKINKFRGDMVTFYAAQQQLDVASRQLAHPDTPQYMSLEEIAEKLLPAYLKVNNKYPPHALYAVHNALQRDEWAFRPLNLKWHRRNYIYEVRPATDIRTLRKVENQVRELIDGAALRENPAQSVSLMKQNSLGSFIMKVRGVIQASRLTRDWTPHGMIGPSKEEEEKKKQETKMLDTHGLWNRQDKEFIRFMELWACHRIVPKASQLETLGSTILRLTDLYRESEWLAHWTAFTFLQEIGWIPPWDIPARYEYKFPDTKVQRGAPIELPPLIDVNESLRQDVAGGMRRDWGDTTVFCVDAESTEDVDDGFSIEPAEKPGEYWIHVHIADPASSIDPGSELARRIQQTPSSLYLPGFQEKMLPRDLELQFSLDPGQPTLTFSAKVNELGQILDHNVEPGIIKNVLHVPKNEVAAILPGLKPQPTTEPFAVGTPPEPSIPNKKITRASALSQEDKDDLLLLTRLCKALSHRRVANGQLPPFQARFASPEVSLQSVVTLGNPDDPDSPVAWAGDPFIRFSHPTTSEADRLVERLMHTAGEVAAKWCSARKIPVPYSTQPEAQRNRSRLAEFRRKHIDPLTSQGRPVPLELLHELFSLVGTSELSADPAHFYSVGLDAYAKSSSPLRRFGDLVTHWQIHAALAHERALGRSLAGQDCSEAEFLPWKRSALAPALPMLQAQQRQIKQVDNKDGPTQWITQAFLRAWRFGEAPLPKTFTFVVDGLYGFGLRGRLSSFYNLSASVDLSRLAGFAKMSEIQVDDLLEVEVVDVNVVTTQIAVQPLLRLGSRQKKATKSAGARVAASA